MTQWKRLVRRWTLATTALALIAGLGGLLGALAGIVLQLAIYALLGAAGSALPVLLGCPALGMGASLLWGCRVLYQHRMVTL